MARASRAKGVAQREAIEQAQAARKARLDADLAMRRAIARAIRLGLSDAVIADAAGLSRQAIWRRRAQAAR